MDNLQSRRICNNPTFSDRLVCANSADQDQLILEDQSDKFLHFLKEIFGYFRVSDPGSGHSLRQQQKLNRQSRRKHPKNSNQMLRKNKMPRKEMLGC